MTDPAPLTPRRRWSRFRLRVSLRAMIVLVLLTGGGFGWLMHSARVQRDAVATIERAGGLVDYGWQVKALPLADAQLELFEKSKNAEPWWPKWVGDTVGVDTLSPVRRVGIFGRATLPPTDLNEVMPAAARLRGVEEFLLHDARNLSDANAVHFRAMTGLRSLHISEDSRLSPAALVAAVGGLTRLERLHLDGLPTADEGMAVFDRLSRLERLVLRRPEISDGAFRHLSGLTALKWLEANRCPSLTSAGLVHLKGLTGLTELEFDKTGVDDLAPLANLTGLRILTIRESPIRDHDLDVVATHLVGLRFLTFEDCPNLTDAVGDRLAKLTSLEVLEFVDTNLTDAVLPSLATLPRLNHLWISGVTDKGMEHLARFPALKSLFLIKTEVTDDGLKRLATRPALERLYLTESKVTDKAVAALQEALPGLKVDVPRRPSP